MNKLLRIFNENALIFTQENAFENVVFEMVASLFKSECINPLGVEIRIY